MLKATRHTLLGLGCLLALPVCQSFWIRPSSILSSLMPAARPSKRICTTPVMKVYAATAGTSLVDAMSAAVSEALGEPVKLSVSDGGGYGGGGGASVGTVKDTKTGTKYFYKSAGIYKLDMLNAEYRGVKEMYDTHTIRVPKPIAVGTSDNSAFVVFEYLAMGGTRGGKTGEEMGRLFAKMHRKTSDNGMYGWDIDNTIGATPQRNKWTKSWADFFIEHRLGHMLKLCKRDGASFYNEAEFLKKVREVLEAHQTVPSLLHGDLWTGNGGVTSDGDPVIFDPATYYGDREADLAMTTLFGSFPPEFYRGYEEEWPLPPGVAQRRVIYNTYHILNHYVLFGGGYAGQAQRMMDQVIKM